MKGALSPDAAAALIPEGASVMIGGFMGVGTPVRLVDELVRQGRRGHQEHERRTRQGGRAEELRHGLSLSGHRQEWRHSAALHRGKPITEPGKAITDAAVPLSPMVELGYLEKNKDIYKTMIM